MKLGLMVIRQNIKAHLGRTILVFITIIISAALIFVAGNVKGTAKDIASTMQKKYVGNADVIVEMNADYKDIGYEKIESDEIDTALDYNIGFYQLPSYFISNSREKIVVDLWNMTSNDVKAFSIYKISEETDKNEISKDEIIISKALANKHGIKLSDKLTIYLNGSQYKFVVAKIAEEEGLFIDDGERNVALVSPEFTDSLIGNDTYINKQYMKLNNLSDKEKITDLIIEHNDNAVVDDAIDSVTVERIANDYSNQFTIIILLVIIICLYLIYTNFAIIYTDEIPTIGVLRSLGTTHKFSSGILFIEGLALGLTGGVIGVAAGTGILKLLLNVVVPESLKNLGIGIVYDRKMYVITVLLTVFMVFISSIKHILFVSKFEIKDIILGNIFISKNPKYWLSIVGVISLFIALILNKVCEISLVLSILRIVLCVTGIALVVSVFILILNKAIEAIGKITGADSMVITAFLGRNNVIVNSNIIVLAFCLACLMLVDTIDNSIYLESGKVFGYSADHEIELQVIGDIGNNLDEIISKTDNSEFVNGVYKSTQIGTTKVGDSDYEFEFLRVYSDNFFDYWNLEIVESEYNFETICNELNTKRCILLSRLSQLVLNVDIGDEVSIEGEKYLVAGIVDSTLRMGIISNAYYKDDFDLSNISETVCVKTPNDISRTADDLNKILESYAVKVMLTSDIENTNYDNYKGVIGMLELFCYLAFAICILGCINNFILSFLNRRKQVATMLSIGSSRLNICLCIITEALINGVAASLLGYILGAALIYVLPEFLVYIQQFVTMVIPNAVVVKCFVFGVMVTLLSSITLINRIYRMNIVENIKYE